MARRCVNHVIGDVTAFAWEQPNCTVIDRAVVKHDRRSHLITSAPSQLNREPEKAFDQSS